MSVFNVHNTKNAFKYKVNESEFDKWAFDLETIWDKENLPGVAEDAADDFHSNHDGWENSWPCEFYIFDVDGNLLGVYVVERESSPIFIASEKKEAAK
jgi:hypothetical protein